MKKIFISLLLTTLLTTSAFAKEYSLGQFKVKTWNPFLQDLVDHVAWIHYDTDNEKMNFQYQDGISTIAFVFDKETKSQFQTLLDKYFQWEEKATSKGVEVDKVIDKIWVAVYLKPIDEWIKAYPTHLTLRFYTQNSIQHQLIITPDSLESRYHDHIVEHLHIDKTDVEKIRTLISDEFLKEALKYIEQKEKIAEEFI